MVTIGRVEMRLTKKLRLRLRLWQTNGTCSFFPLTALLEKLNALKTLEHRTLTSGTARCLE